jgi:ornithine cyclodeaminase
VRAVSSVRPVRAVRVFSRGRAGAERFAEWIRADATLPVRVTVCDTAKAAVADAPIVCTATSTADRTPLLAADWVAPGAHVNVVGGTHEDAIEVDPALLATAFVVVEELSAALADAGEVRAALAAGLLDVAGLHELGALVSGTVVPAGRTTVFRSVGLPVEDTAAAVALAGATDAG